jgi:hypothetical protein
MTGEAIAREARRLLTDEMARREMKAALAEVKDKLSLEGRGTGPLIQEIVEGQVAHVS